MATPAENVVQDLHSIPTDELENQTTAHDLSVIRNELWELEARDKEELTEIFIAPDIPHIITYPYLLSKVDEVELTIDELETEISLILEMRTANAIDTEPSIYSIDVVEPRPFEISEQLLEELEGASTSLSSNIQSGFLIHDDLYELCNNQNKFHDILFAFLSSCEKLEIKLKPKGESLWQKILVKLIE